MVDIKKTYFDPNLEQSGTLRDTNAESLSDSSWFHYTFQPEVAEGFYRFYIDSNLFVLTNWDFTLKEDLIQDFNQTDCISVASYDAVEGRILRPYQRTLKPCIMGHLGNDEMFRIHIHKNKPYRGAGIMIFPQYYKDYLQSAYPEEYENPRDAFASIEGITSFSEFRPLFRQINNCRSKGISAKLFYAGKVAECVSLIVEKSKTQRPRRPVHQICRQDRENLQSLVSYIESNLNDRLLLEDLARVAHMGTTKLKYTFKQVHKSTISEFILAKRLNRAEHLLSNSDLNISQVSRNVGYKNAGKFSEIFRDNMGLLPNEYRKLIAAKDFPPVAGKKR